MHAENNQKNTAPSPDSSSLSEGVRENLKQQLEHNFREIKRRYAWYVDILRERIKAKKINVDELCGFIENLAEFDSNKNEEQLKVAKDKLRSAETMCRVFRTISEHCASFLDFEIFEAIRERYGIEQDDDHLRYADHVRAYVEKHKISEFFTINPRLEKKCVDASDEIIIKFDIHLNNKLDKVVGLKRALANILKVQTTALQLIAIEEGCVIMIYLIPTFMVQTICRKFTKSQVEEFRSLSALWVICGECKFDFRRAIFDKYDSDAGELCSSTIYEYAGEPSAVLSTVHLGQNKVPVAYQ